MEVAWNCCHNALPAHILGTSPFQNLAPAASWIGVKGSQHFLGLASPLLFRVLNKTATWPGPAWPTMGTADVIA